MADKSYSYYTSSAYIGDKWKPEQISDADLKALARAEAAARYAGVLKDELAQYFLPNALVENRPADYGVNNRQAEGGTVGDIDANQSVGPITPQAQFGPPALHGPVSELKRSHPHNAVEGNAENAKLASMILSSRGRTAEESIEIWHGEGASARNHLTRVKEARSVLEHEANAEMYGTYQRYLNAAMKELTKAERLMSQQEAYRKDAQEMRRRNFDGE